MNAVASHVERVAQALANQERAFTWRLAGLYLWALLICAVAVPAAAQQTVTVNLGADRGPATYRASGFLHSILPSQPATSLVTPVKPKLFRCWYGDCFNIYSRVKSLGSEIQVVLSDGYGYGSPAWPGSGGNWALWEENVALQVGLANTNGYTLQWDVWNEPNIGQFWNGTQAQFFETWRRAVIVIRSLNPGAVIVGPSLSGFDQSYLQAFLTFAKNNNVLPDVVSWHEFSGGAVIPANVQTIRSWMAANAINIPRISINEMIYQSEYTNPGATVRYLAGAERAGVESAAHACWGDTGGDNCFASQSLDGILTFGGSQPRSVWWAYKGYADVTGTIVDVSPSANVDGVAGRDAALQTAAVVLGRTGGTGNVSVRFTNISSAPYLNNGGPVRVVAQRIPDSNTAALAAPTTMLDANFTVSNNEFTVVLANFGASDAYTLRLLPVNDIIAPMVTSVSPANGATGVAINTPVTVTFSEAMNAATIAASALELRNSATNALIGASVTYNPATQVATLAPSAALTGSTGYTIRVLGGTTDPRVKDGAGNPLATTFTSSFTTLPPDGTKPLISAVSPANGATGVPIHTPLTITFSEAMDVPTVWWNTITLRNTATNALVQTAVTYNITSGVATVSPTVGLTPSTNYTLTVAGGTADPRVRDLAGNSLAATFTSSFTTAAPDTVAPMVTSVAPVNGATGVPINIAVAVSFNEAISATTISRSTIELRNTLTNALETASVTYNALSRVVTVTPAVPLAMAANYTVRVLGGAVEPRVKDWAGNALGASFAASFTTVLPDTTPPAVTSVSPADGAVNVAINSAALVSFSEALDMTTVSTSTIELRNASTNAPIASTLTYNTATHVASLIPGAPLAGSTHYTVRVLGGAAAPRVKDLAGNALAGTFVSSFTTADITPPTVTSANPANGATVVPVTAAVTATFSEAMDATTVSTSTMELRNTSTDALITSTVSYNVASNSATLTPSAALPGSTSFTVRVLGGATDPRVKDLSGNPLAGTFIASFTTADVTPPVVTSATPVNGSTGISLAAVVTVTFSEAMDVTTLSTSTIELRNSSTSALISSRVIYNSATNVATLTPGAPLSPLTNYTLRVLGGASDPRVKDQAGNPLTVIFASSFTTEDTVPPGLAITSHINDQLVNVGAILISGSASDGGFGDNGVLSVTVNGQLAPGGSAVGSATAHWSQSIALLPGANFITVVAKDASANQNSSTVQITVNFKPLPAISINNVQVSEGNSGAANAVFALELTAANDQTVTVNYSTADGSATAGSDYVAQSGIVTFNPGETTKNITIQVTGDTNIEPNETFYVNLSSATNATIATGQGTGTIINDDVALGLLGFYPTASGFDVDFNKPIDASTLNLYGTQTGNFGPPDVTLVGAVNGPVSGSLIVDAVAGEITFVKTGGVLAPDTYTVTLRSAVNGFKDMDGNLLDGDGDAVPGGDYVASFTVAPSDATVLSVPDFSFGPGQVVNVPFNQLGLPIVVSNAATLTAIEFKLTYNPTLLTVSGFTPETTLPADATIVTDIATAGVVSIQVTAPTGLGTAAVELGRLVASVPLGAGYKAAQIITLEIVGVMPGTVIVQGDDAVHLVAYLGNATGKGRYNSVDAQRVKRVALRLDSGFAAYLLIDPMIIADVTGNGMIDSIDATRILEEIVGIDRPEIAPIP